MSANSESDQPAKAELPASVNRLAGMKEAALLFVRRSFVRSIGILVGGTVAAHAITMLAMPISTRLYSPEDFSALSIYSSIVGIISVVACLRYDAAIILPEKDEDAANLLILSGIFCIAIGLATALTITLLPDWVFDLLGTPKFLPYLWLIPVGVVVTGLYIAAQAWFVRVKKFPSVARSRILQATAGAGSQIAMGVAGIAPLGLLIGQLLNYGAGSVFLLTRAISDSRDLFGKVSWQRMREIAKTYDKFPKYSVWEGIANGISNSGPLLIIAALAPGPEAGFLTLSLFALQAPLALVGNATGQVYVSEAANAHREGRLGTFTADVLTGLATAGAGPLLFAALVSPFAFGPIFGDQWVRSGFLVSWMSPWFFLQFLASPICNALHISGQQKTMMTFHIIGMVVRVGGVLVAGAFAADFISEVWAVTGWIFYAGYLGTILWIVKLPLGSYRKVMRKMFLSAAVGGAFGLICIMALLAVYP